MSFVVLLDIDIRPPVVTSVVLTNTTATVFFTTSGTDAIAVHVYAVPSNGGPTLSAYVFLPATSYTFTSLNPNVSYTFYVTEVEAGGEESLPSNSLSGTAHGRRTRRTFHSRTKVAQGLRSYRQ